MQLDLLLRSMPQEMAHKAWVIIRCSDTGYYNGYLRIIDEHEGMFVFQSDFKRDVIEAINPVDGLTVFFTDDDVFINPMPTIPNLEADPPMSCISLRLHPNMDYCYTMDKKQKRPDIVSVCPANTDCFLTWEWGSADADYGYPMSLDGHVFRTADILPLLQQLGYHDPNSLEGQLARHPIKRPYMACFDRSIIVNNPINRVQNTARNRHGDISARELNDLWLSGKRIKLDPFKGYENKACHEEIPLEFE